MNKWQRQRKTLFLKMSEKGMITSKAKNPNNDKANKEKTSKSTIKPKRKCGGCSRNKPRKVR